jgi:aspartyl-tRNA(Asn)/glutamyl-tRNA(Gln) amidotransferase subunit C
VNNPLSREDVQKVALLARLDLTEEELDRFTAELQQIIGYVDQLGEVDTANVEPMVHAMELANVFAEDRVRQSLPREDTLANAPRHNGVAFLVPAVLGD